MKKVDCRLENNRKRKGKDPDLAFILKVASSLNTFSQDAADNRLEKVAFLIEEFKPKETCSYAHPHGFKVTISLQDIVIGICSPCQPKKLARKRAYDSAINHLSKPNLDLKIDPTTGKKCLTTIKTVSYPETMKFLATESTIYMNLSCPSDVKSARMATSFRSNKNQKLESDSINVHFSLEDIPKQICDLVLYIPFGAATSYQVLTQSAILSNKDAKCFCQKRPGQWPLCRIIIDKHLVATAAGTEKSEASINASNIALKKLKTVCWCVKEKGPSEKMVFSPSDFYPSGTVRSFDNFDSKKVEDLVLTCANSKFSKLYFTNKFTPTEIADIKCKASNFKLVFRTSNSLKYGHDYYVVGHNWKITEVLKELQFCGGENSMFKLFPPGSDCQGFGNDIEAESATAIESPSTSMNKINAVKRDTPDNNVQSLQDILAGRDVQDGEWEVKGESEIREEDWLFVDDDEQGEVYEEVVEETTEEEDVMHEAVDDDIEFEVIGDEDDDVEFEVIDDKDDDVVEEIVYEVEYDSDEVIMIDEIADEEDDVENSGSREVNSNVHEKMKKEKTVLVEHIDPNSTKNQTGSEAKRHFVSKNKNVKGQNKDVPVETSRYNLMQSYQPQTSHPIVAGSKETSRKSSSGKVEGHRVKSQPVSHSEFVYDGHPYMILSEWP